MAISKDFDLIVGLNLNEVDTQITNIWKMTWEQVLLLALYSRRQYFEQDAFSFRQRMRLIHALDTLKQKRFYGIGSNVNAEDFLEQYIIVLRKVENGHGSNDILEYLFDDEGDKTVLHSQQQKTIKKIISEAIEQRGIAFSKSSGTGRELHYSYYTMYKALKDLVPTLQLTLKYQPPNIKEVYYDCMVNLFEESRKNFSIESVGDMLVRMNKIASIPKKQYIESNLEAFTSFFANEQNKKQLKQLFYKRLIDGNPSNETYPEYSQFTGIGEWAKKVFNELSLISDKEKTGFTDFYTFKEQDDQLQITLHKSQIRDLSNLGLLKSLFNTMATQVEVEVGSLEKQHKTILNRDTVESVEKISDWYSQNNVGLFSRINQVPGFIAYILKFDTEFALGVFDVQIGGINLDGRGLNGFNRPKKTSEKNFLISVIIKYCLYHGMEFKNFYNNFVYASPNLDNKSTIKSSRAFIKYFEDNLKEKTETDGNEILSEWAHLSVSEDDKKGSNTQDDIDSKAHNRVMNRFKRMPKHQYSKNLKIDYLESSDTLHNLIREQKYQLSADKAVAYPFNSSFPLPLWVTRLN